MNNLARYYDKLKGSTLACIGFILSPLSWWNDAYVNIPIAYVIAWLVSLFRSDLFLYAFIGAYLMTNVLGFVLLQKGIGRTLAKPASERVRYTSRQFVKDLAISVCYTLLMVVLVETGVIKPPGHYFR